MNAIDEHDAPVTSDPRTWQDRLIGAYGAAADRGLLDSTAARTIFEVSYGAYKAAFEAGPVGQLRHVVRPGGLVIDIGANVGFFAVRFARWVQPGGRVLALEPEQVNADRLERRLRRRRLVGTVEVVRAVATDHDGVAHLAVNRRHPGDHKIGAAGVTVAAHTIDVLVEQRPARRVCLLKIDVQGAELKVLAGAARTIAEHRPALFVEIHEPSLAAFGTSGLEVLQYVTGRGYTAHRISRAGIGPAQDPTRLAGEFAARYGDVLLLPPSA